MTPFEWIVRADAADETDAAIVAEVLAGAVRDERNDPDEPVEVSARPSAESASLIAPTDRDTEVPVTNSSPDYRSTVRETLSRLSDEALRFQDAHVVGGIDREELDAEIARRAAGTSRLGSPDRYFDGASTDELEQRRIDAETAGNEEVVERISAAPLSVELEPGERAVVVDLESGDRAVLGEYACTEEDAVGYWLEDGTLHWAPEDCVEIVPGARKPGGGLVETSREEPTEEPTPEELRAEADRATLWGAARGTVALARSLHSGDGDPIDDLVLALARSSGGPYALLASVFRLLDSEEELDAEKSLANWTSYGTETQYAMMRRVARGVVGNASGCRETFADILHATSERASSVPPVRLAEERPAGLDSISERDSIWSHRRAARAEAVAAGATFDEASDAWSAAMALDHPKAAS